MRDLKRKRKSIPCDTNSTGQILWLLLHLDQSYESSRHREIPIQKRCPPKDQHIFYSHSLSLFYQNENFLVLQIKPEQQ